MFEKSILQKIFGPKTDEMTGHWKNLHQEDRYILYIYNIIWVVM